MSPPLLPTARTSSPPELPPQLLHSVWHRLNFITRGLDKDTRSTETAGRDARADQNVRGSFLIGTVHRCVPFCSLLGGPTVHREVRVGCVIKILCGRHSELLYPEVRRWC